MTHRCRRRSALGPILLAGILTVRVAAQCVPTFQPGELAGSPVGSVGRLLVWDPDGAGPLPDLLVAGGSFAVGANQGVSVAGWDGTEWQVLGTPPAGQCTALATFGGRLVAVLARSSLASDIATYDGAVWQVIGTVNGTIGTMAIFNGNLIVGGAFGRVGNLNAASIAQWDGSTWAALGVGAGGVSGAVYALAVYSGSLYVGGDITFASGIPVGNLAVWNGTGWAASAVFDGTVTALAVRITTAITSSHLFVGGAFSSVGAIAARRVARFNAVNGWFAMGAGLPNGNCTLLYVRATGLTSYELTAGVYGDPPNSFSRWNGTAWAPLGNGPGSGPAALTLFRGRYCGAAGPTVPVRGLDASGNWPPLSGTGIDGLVREVHATASDVVIGGDFTSISGVVTNGIARGTFGAWQPLGGGVQGGSVVAITTMPNGDVIAAGDFTSAGGTSATAIARWDGSAWSPLGAGIRRNTFPGRVFALAVLPNGHLIAGGDFTEAGGQPASNIARWDGAGWQPLGLGTDAAVSALAVTPNGDLIVGGLFEHIAGAAIRGVARWNGTWLPFPAQPNGAAASLAVLSDGQLLVGGFFSTVGNTTMPFMARWNGVSWFAVPGFTFAPFGSVDIIVPLPRGEALVHTNQLSWVSNPPMARFDGQACSPLPYPRVEFYRGARSPQGEVLLAGSFTAIGGVACAFLARLVSPCPARAPTYGSGCNGSAGANRLQVRELPWIGTYFRAEATGLPAVGLALAVTGVAPTSIPIASLLRQGLPGCDLLATLDLLEPVTPRLGAAPTQLFVPLDVALAGAVLHHQVVAFELDGASNVLAITSTNGLRLTIGAF